MRLVKAHRVFTEPGRIIAAWVFAASGLAASGVAAAADLEETTITQASERHLPDDGPVMLWSLDPQASSASAGDTLETVEVDAVKAETVKLTDVVPPIHFESGEAQIPDSTVEALRKVLAGMADRHNVRVNLVGHADSQPLSPRLEKIYGDNIGLSQARAGQVAEYFKQALGLPAEAISFEWAGATRPVASNETSAGRALNRRVEVEVWYDRLEDTVATDERLRTADLSRVKVCRIETVCKLRYVDGHERRARVVNLLAPLHYDEEGVDVTPGFAAKIRRTLQNLADKRNVVVRFVGHTDDAPLSGTTERIYGNHDTLSKARARRVALAVQDQLGLPTAAVESDGEGASRPLASNDTPQGRALNRRVEVEFWYDDPLQDLPDEPQLCPGEPGAGMVTRVYDPPWGSIDRIELDSGKPVLPAGYTGVLQRALDDVSGKTNPRLRFVGYTRNEGLDRRTARVYGDDIGLSAARAKRAMEAVAADLGLEPGQTEFEGHGFVQSDDVVNAGFVQGDTSFVAVEVVYDELAVLDDNEGVDVTPLTRELEPRNPYALNLMRITVDGEPIDDPGRSSADVQRCTDVAMQKADIRFTFDNLTSSPRLSAAASPSRVLLHGDGDGGMTGDAVRFRMYANYEYFIDRAEIRIFDSGQSARSAPRAVVPVGDDGTAEWTPRLGTFASAVRELQYVLRAYSEDGKFDETEPQPLWMLHDTSISAVEANVMEYFKALDGETRTPAPVSEPAAAVDPLLDRRLLAEYGQNSLSIHNIRLSSGTVRVHGSDVPEGHQVYVAGRPVPVDDAGNFVSEEVLPEGTHTVEVAVLDEQGHGESYLRDLAFEPDDWFYVGMADLTLAHNEVDGPLDQLTGANATYDPDSSADGRMAFYVNGKFGDHWRLTASADSGEAPVGDMFTSFDRKTPQALLRRLDPDQHYPTFGDDGTVEEMAPTSGKLYLKLSQRKSFGLWGNFSAGYMQNELAQIDRGLYGGQFHYETQSTTSFGEQRLSVDAFGAQPGTVPSRQEFRGTGGSLYFLRHQDLTIGSERLRIEIRDRTSGLVTGVVNLSPTVDYDIDYIQGSVLLAEPLASTVSDDLLVRGGALSGDEAYLVVRYEYTPGLDEVDALATGGQVHGWINDHVGLGVTASANEDGSLDSSLNGADLTLRASADTWLKVQAAESEGLESLALRSDDGGFGFSADDPASYVDDSGRALRADLSIGLGDVWSRLPGSLTVYGQDVEGGFSAPGLATATDRQHYGGTLTLPMTDRLAMLAKVDRTAQETGIETDAAEVDVNYQLSRNWRLSTGIRNDQLTDHRAVAAATPLDGERTDGLVEVGYDPGASWRAYGFVQQTLSKDGAREDNDRFGMGSAFRLSEKITVETEVSDGDLGPGGRLGTSYMHSERTSLYLNYLLENERSDPALRGPTGGDGTLVSGVKSRLSDSTSVFLEERYRHGTATGLTHATGVDFSAAERWTLGANTDIGTLSDSRTGAETDRRAVGVRFGYGTHRLQISSAVEHRRDDVVQPDASSSRRTTWLFRNNVKMQLSPAYRLLGKYNHAASDSSLGDYFGGGYTEAVAGFAYRPVDNDRLNALVKYTYFYNVPTTGQQTTNGSAAEYLQRSHVASVDVDYDLTARWSLGAKYAYRYGQVSLDREDPEFFDNSASLYVVRADWRLRENWEVLMESRLLDMADLDESRAGALFALSRYMGDHVKVGVGYNFTDFSSDLTDLGYDHQGVFLNVTGAF